MIRDLLSKLRESRFHRAVKRIAVEFVLFRVIIPFALLCVYFFGVGVTSLAAKIFFRAGLKPGLNASGSSWVLANGYQVTRENGIHQS